MTFKRIFFFLISVVVVSSASAQAPADLYVFKLHKANNRYVLYQPKLLSGFNPDGYTNQPWFTPDGNLLVSVRRKGDSQNDIYRLSLADNRLRQLTSTSSNEFSPRFDPTGQYLSVVRQVRGDTMNQQIFITGLSGGGYKSILPDRKDIGYYTWLDKDHLALYRIEGESNRLEKYDVADQKARKITSAVGRSLWTDKTGSVVYVHKFSSDYWYLKRFNADSFSMDIIAQTPGMTEDFALAPDGTFFMGLGGKLYCLQPDQKDSWQVVADLTLYGITDVTRLAISPDGTMIAVVTSKN